MIELGSLEEVRGKGMVFLFICATQHEIVYAFDFWQNITICSSERIELKRECKELKYSFLASIFLVWAFFLNSK